MLQCTVVKGGKHPDCNRMPCGVTCDGMEYGCTTLDWTDPCYKHVVFAMQNAPNSTHGLHREQWNGGQGDFGPLRASPKNRFKAFQCEVVLRAQHPECQAKLPCNFKCDGDYDDGCIDDPEWRDPVAVILPGAASAAVPAVDGWPCEGWVGYDCDQQFIGYSSPQVVKAACPATCGVCDEPMQSWMWEHHPSAAGLAAGEGAGGRRQLSEGSCGSLVMMLVVALMALAAVATFIVKARRQLAETMNRTSEGMESKLYGFTSNDPEDAYSSGKWQSDVSTGNSSISSTSTWSEWDEEDAVQRTIMSRFGDDRTVLSSILNSSMLGDLELGEVIGRGASSAIYQARLNGGEVALKHLRLNERGSDVLKEFAAEIKIMSKLNHPNVVHYLGFTTNPQCLIIQELATNGDLRTYLQVIRHPALRCAMRCAQLHPACTR